MPAITSKWNEAEMPLEITRQCEMALAKGRLDADEIKQLIEVGQAGRTDERLANADTVFGAVTN